MNPGNKKQFMCQLMMRKIISSFLPFLQICVNTVLWSQVFNFFIIRLKSFKLNCISLRLSFESQTRFSHKANQNLINQGIQDQPASPRLRPEIKSTLSYQEFDETLILPGQSEKGKMLCHRRNIKSYLVEMQ